MIAHKIYGKLIIECCNKLAKGIHKIKLKYGPDNKNCDIFGIKYRDYKCFIEIANVKSNLIEYKSFCCNKLYQKTFREILKKRYANT